MGALKKTGFTDSLVSETGAMAAVSDGNVLFVDTVKWGASGNGREG